MQVKIGQQNNEMQKEVKANPGQGKVVVASNPIRIREMLDKAGNVIDPRTKQIIRPVNQKES